MVVLAALALLLVVARAQTRLRNRVSCPFVKTLSQKLGTRPAKMHPFPFLTPFRLRRNPTVLLHLNSQPSSPHNCRHWAMTWNSSGIILVLPPH
jgi:hypothetical protein